MASLAAACGEAPPAVSPHPPKAEAPQAKTPPTPTPLGDAGKFAPIASGEIRFLELDLEAGHFLHLEVEQKGIDLGVELKNPSGETLAKIDSPNGAWGPEEVILLVPTTGRHRLEVKATGKAGSAGELSWKRVASRAPTARDRQLVVAEGAYRAGHAARRARDFVPASESFREAWESFSKLGLPLRQAEALEGLFRVTEGGGNQELAASLAERAARLFEADKETRRAASLARQAGLLRLQLGQLLAAEDDLERALRNYRSVNDGDGEAFVLGALAATHHTGGRLQRALTRLEQSFETLGEGGNPSTRASLLTAYARLLLDLGRAQDAATAALEASEIFRRLNQRENLDKALLSLATAYSEAGDHEPAKRALLEAMSGAEAQSRTLLDATARLDAGMVLWRAGSYDEAESILRQAASQARKKEPKTTAETLVALGALLTASGRADEGLTHLRQAGQVFLDLNDVKGKASAAARAAEALLALKRPKEAWRELQPALAAVEGQRAQTERRDYRSSYYAVRQDYYRLGLEILLLCHEQDPSAGYDRQAWQVHERRLARELVEARRLRAASLPDRNTKAHHQLEQELMARLGEAALLRDTESRDLEARRLLGELNHLRSEAELRLTAPEESRTELTLDLATVQRDLLDPESLLLVYALGERRSVLWVISTSSFETFTLPARTEIEGLCRDWVLRLKDRRRSGQDFETRLGRELAAKLLGPVEPMLGHRRLLFVADGALQALPWGALPRPGAEGEARVLLTNHEITTLPSIRTLVDLRAAKRWARRPTSPRQVAVLADPVFSAEDPRLPGQASHPSPAGAAADSDERELLRSAAAVGLDSFARLPESRGEAEAILELVPTGERRLVTDFEASREGFLALPFERLGVLHLATHALLDASTPELSGLVFSRFDRLGNPKSGFLRSVELGSLRLPGTLVVLSACESGIGRNLEGEGMSSLMRAFFEAGANGVVASLWPVSDQRTAALMKQFYRGYLQRGLTPTEALRQAQLTLATSEDSSDPFYWAGFFYQGDREVW